MKRYKTVRMNDGSWRTVDTKKAAWPYYPLGEPVGYGYGIRAAARDQTDHFNKQEETS